MGRKSNVSNFHWEFGLLNKAWKTCSKWKGKHIVRILKNILALGSRTIKNKLQWWGSLTRMEKLSQLFLSSVCDLWMSWSVPSGKTVCLVLNPPFEGLTDFPWQSVHMVNYPHCWKCSLYYKFTFSCWYGQNFKYMRYFPYVIRRTLPCG